MMRLHGNTNVLAWVLRNLGCLLFSAVFALCPGIVRGADDQEQVKFRWAFGALKQSGTEQKLEAIGSSPTTLRTGDQLKMMVERESDCFVYVIHYSSQDAIKLLFPYSLKQFSDDYQQQKKYYIPETDRWFELDQHTGRETFYLLASAKRLDALEKLLDQYENADLKRKAEIAKQVLDEISTLKKQHRELPAAAERPETIGGSVRGFEKAQGMNRPDISVMAREVSVPGFVARTFTIEHQ
jgi:hypothetical protein